MSIQQTCQETGTKGAEGGSSKHILATDKALQHTGGRQKSQVIQFNPVSGQHFHMGFPWDFSLILNPVLEDSSLTGRQATLHTSIQRRPQQTFLWLQGSTYTSFP